MRLSRMTLACAGIESLMHGVAYFTFEGTQCTAHYRDHTEETAHIPEVLRVAMRNYFDYQNAGGKACDAPNTFALVSAIQSHAKATT